MEINIVMLNGAARAMMVNPNDTVGSLKKKIQTELGVSVFDQKLVVDNGHRRQLTDESSTLSACGLQPGSRVSLLVAPAVRQVFLRNEKGKLSTYKVEPEETVEAFKSKVAQREKVPVSQQRLIHQGREMMTGQLKDYDVTDGSTIDMVFRLRGG